MTIVESMYNIFDFRDDRSIKLSYRNWSRRSSSQNTSILADRDDRQIKISTIVMCDLSIYTCFWHLLHHTLMFFLINSVKWDHLLKASLIILYSVINLMHIQRYQVRCVVKLNIAHKNLCTTKTRILLNIECESDFSRHQAFAFRDHIILWSIWFHLQFQDRRKQ